MVIQDENGEAERDAPGVREVPGGDDSWRVVMVRGKEESMCEFLTIPYMFYSGHWLPLSFYNKESET
jgi:hypothetical protein